MNTLNLQKNYSHFDSHFYKRNSYILRNSTMIKRPNRTGCRFTGPYYFYKLTNISLDIFNIENKQIQVLLGHYNNFKLLNNSDFFKVKTKSNLNLNTNKTYLCTLFTFDNSFGYQPMHTFTLEVNDDTIKIHQSWSDGKINVCYKNLHQELPRPFVIQHLNNILFNNDNIILFMKSFKKLFLNRHLSSISSSVLNSYKNWFDGKCIELLFISL